MPRRRTRRRLALFALALALFAALPCAALAGSDACCGAMAKCAKPSESPCARLASAACCEARGVAVAAAVTPLLPAAPDAVAFEIFSIPAELPLPPRAPAPRALSDHRTIRDVLLRL